MSHLIKPADKMPLQGSNSSNNNLKNNEDVIKTENENIEEIDFSGFGEHSHYSDFSDGFDASIQDLLAVQKINQQFEKKSTEIEIL